jgi:hypothetical protein
MSLDVDKRFEKYDELIDRSVYREKIRTLQRNCNLASTVFDKERNLRPCCWGTAVYIVGGNARVKELWKSTGRSLDDYSDACGDFVCIPDDNYPGYVGELPMELFLRTCEPTESDKDTLVAFSWDVPDTELCGFRLRHTGVALGKKYGATIFFHQKNEGDVFDVCSIYELMASLSEYSLSTLRYKFYMARTDSHPS